MRARPQSARPVLQFSTKPHAELTGQRFTSAPPQPSVTAMHDAVARGCATASVRIQNDREKLMLLATNLPPKHRPSPQSEELIDGHYLPSPGLGVRASKQLYVSRPNGPRDPELLQKLLHMVRQGLRGAEPGSYGYIEHRLDVFRRAFGHYITAYGAYAPLLLGVQEAYEDALAQATARAEGVNDVTERLSLMQDEARQLLEHQNIDYGEEKEAMDRVLAERDVLLQEKQKENDRLFFEVRRLKADVQHKERQKEDADLRCLELTKQVEHWQAETNEARKQSVDQAELERLRRELKAMTEREIMLLGEDKEQRQLFRETKMALDNLRATSVAKESFKQVDDQLKRTQANLKAAKAEVDELKRMLAGGESHMLYPNGLQWADHALDVAYLDPGWRGSTPHEIISDLVLDVLTLQHSRKAGGSGTGGGGGGTGGGGETTQMFALESADLQGIGGHGGPDSAEGADPSGAIALLRGEQSKSRGMSSFDGFVRVRPGLWKIDQVRDCVKRLWTSYRKHPRVLTMQGGARRALPPAERFMRPEIVQEILGELMSNFLAHRHAEAERLAAGTPSDARSTSNNNAANSHRGLLCADTYNLQAAMWALRDEEPICAMFVQVCLGRLPPGIFAELHKVCSGLYRSLASAAKNEKVSLDAVRQKLATALPGCPELEREALITFLIKADKDDGGGKGGGPSGANGLRIKQLEPAHKEPCEGKLASAGMVQIQRFFLVSSLRLRYDLEDALKRMATSKFFAEPHQAVVQAMEAPPPSSPAPIAAEGGGATADKGSKDIRSAQLAARDLRQALVYVDAEAPSTYIEDHVSRVFSKTSAPTPAASAEVVAAPLAAGGVAAPAQATSGSGEASVGGEDSQFLTLEEVCARLFAEPLRRYSPRTNQTLCEAVSTQIRSGDKGGKKKKGGAKKGKKGGDASEAMISIQRLRDALLKGDGGARPPLETEFVAASVFNAARRITSERPAQPSSPPGSPRPGSPGGLAGDEEEAPMEIVLEALKDSLLQRIGS